MFEAKILASEVTNWRILVCQVHRWSHRMMPIYFFFVLQFPVIEEYFFKLPLKLIFNTIHDFAYIHIS